MMMHQSQDKWVAAFGRQSGDLVYELVQSYGAEK
jgi:hypothetical protein